MKTVTLFRHAKSGWKDSPEIDDFDRPLAERGIKAARQMGRIIWDYGLRPDLILCSPSVRTRQTLSLAGPEAWDKLPKVVFDDRLYHGDVPTMMKILKSLPEDVAHAMIVGHNPGLQSLAVRLAAAENGAGERLSEKFPTAAIASFTSQAPRWAELSAASGKLRLFITPNMLKAA